MKLSGRKYPEGYDLDQDPNEWRVMKFMENMGLLVLFPKYYLPDYKCALYTGASYVRRDYMCALYTDSSYIARDSIYL